MKIYHIISAFAAGALLAITATSCEDMMDTDTDTHRFDQGLSLDNAADSLYSVMGILSQMQKIGERYVLLGELRGDLVSVTTDAPYAMQEVANFEVAADNEYLSQRDYYAIINNCNFALQRLDTEVTLNNDRVLLREAVAIRTLRDWTLLQMGLNFGSAKFITEPLLSLEQTLAQWPDIPLDNLVPQLIADLQPYVAIETPDYGNIDGLESRLFFVQPRLLLADLHLYNNDYTEAAQLYYSYIENTRITIDFNRANNWNNTSMDAASLNFTDTYTSQNEVLTTIPYSSDAKEIHPNLVNLTYNTLPAAVPATWWADEMAAASFYFTRNLNDNVISGVLQGDLRGKVTYRGTIGEAPISFGQVKTGINSKANLITKFYNNSSENSTILATDNQLFADNPSLQRIVRQVPLYRTPHVYLRYAEAVNRAGKPTLAFAVLKCGLNAETLAETSTAVDPEELADQAAWTNFATLNLDNRGTAMRGRGAGIRLAGCGYDIPDGLTADEKIEYVEEEILREMAAETAFEGNRFFDLLRISRHRADHPALFIDHVAARAANPEAIRSRLANAANWWIK